MSVGNVELWLKKQREFIVLDCAAKIHFHAQSPFRKNGNISRVKSQRAGVLGLGFSRCSASLAAQRVQILTVSGIHGNSRACGNAQDLPADNTRNGNRLQDVLDTDGRVGSAGNPCQYDDEPIGSMPGDYRIRTRESLHDVRGSFDDIVALGVAKRLAQQSKSVEIE
jgi:hypothetical protein